MKNIKLPKGVDTPSSSVKRKRNKQQNIIQQKKIFRNMVVLEIFERYASINRKMSPGQLVVLVRDELSRYQNSLLNDFEKYEGEMVKTLRYQSSLVNDFNKCEGSKLQDIAIYFLRRAEAEYHEFWHMIGLE